MTMTKTQLHKLTKAALNRLYSPSTARHLWELHEMGVSVGTLARARKVLDGFKVTPCMSERWTFEPVTYWYRKGVGLLLYEQATSTMIEIIPVDED